MFRSPFFRRLFLPYLLLICLVTVAVGLFGAAGLRGSFLERTRQSLRNQSSLAADLLRADLRAGREEGVRQEARRVGAEIRCRVTVVAEDGRVVADTEADPAAMENHRLRAEIVAAAVNGEGDSIRPSATVHQELMYFARRVDIGAGPATRPGVDVGVGVGAAADKPSGVYFVRLAMHLAELDSQLWTLYGGLGAVGLVAVVVAGALCYRFARGHAAPLVELTGFADALAHGDLNRRLLRPAKGEIATLTASLNSMADSLSAMVAQAGKDKAELLTILASMNEGVIATDTEQRILLVNEAAAKLLGFDAQGAAGKRLWEVVRPTPILQAADAVIESRRSRVFPVGPLAGRHLEITVCTFPSKPAPLHPGGNGAHHGAHHGTHRAAGATAGSGSGAAGGHAEGLILVAHDTTQSVQYQELRKEFVANVSHELRTPLSIIKGFAETLRDGALGDRVRGPEYLRIIEKHVDQLTNLVNDLLELSKLESQPGLAKRSPVDVGTVVRRVGEMLQPVAERKKQELSVAVAANLPLVAGDPDYLERAIGNLVDNAVKYTPEGGRVAVEVRCDRLPGFGADGAVTVEVRDNGIGIPADDLPRIFERFYRVDRSRSREMGGTGLGLSIVKHVVHGHGGKIEVASTPGAGSTFSLKLPAPAGLSRALT